ncbi:MAG: transcriptional antiterminator, Rof [Sulfuriferula sp.]|nr:transcriptional antiterminator, Rof [Sulfuriferula sp.]
MNLSDEYRPVACALHERLEFAVLKHQQLQVRYLDPARQEAQAIVLPLDVYTANSAEWLKMQHVDGRMETLRLDALLSFVELV